MTASPTMSALLAVALAALRRFFDETIAYRGVAPEVEAEVEANARAQTIRLGRALVLIGAGSSLLWWPSDSVFFQGRPEVRAAFTSWRLGSVALCLFYFLSADRWAFARRHFAAWAMFLATLLILECAWFTGAVGGVEAAWFGLFYMAPCITFTILMRPRERLGAIVLVSIASFSGYFLAHPQNMDTPALGNVLAINLFAAIVAGAMGHALYHTTRVSFLQARELESLTRTLSDRVRERTEELRLLAAHVENLRETERGALARELHDELGQILTGMRVELDVAVSRLERGGDVAAQHARLAELLDATLASARSLLSRLRPRVLDDFGIVAALEWLVADTARRAGVDIAFGSEPPELELPPHVATAVFRIAQESLTNVMRHAGAKRVKIDLSLGERGLVMTIADDGRGLPPPEQRRRASMGLVGMRERAQALGGTLALGDNSPRGTLVTLLVPVSATVVQEAA